MTQTIWKVRELEIRQEADACREACKHCKVGDVMQHIHHEKWLEILTEPIEKRIAFILANKTPPEQAERLRRLRPFNREKAEADWKKAEADWRKAYADWKKAEADWKKAEADWKKAYADWKKAEADLKKADADWKKACADWKKACAGLGKACADWKKAYADLDKADADWKKAVHSPQMLALHAQVCGCPWGKTHDIFGKKVL